MTDKAIGSVHYISPEQAKGSKIDYRTDIYSLGVVMYEMLTGKLPFEGETALQVVMQHLNAVPLAPSELMSGIPKGLDEVVMHAMCANIGKRYASAEALYADLEQLKNDAHARFGYAYTDEETGETQVIGRDVQRAARRTAAQEQAAHAAAQRRETATAVREPEGFFDRLAERPGLAAGIAVAVVAVIALVVVGLLMATGGSGEEKLTVPSLVGQTIDDVMADASYTSQFTIEEAAERKESNRPVGEILEQDPEPGTKVTKGTIITLTVSAGGDNVSDTYKIIDFKGRTLEYAQAMLDEHDVSYQTKEEYSDEVESGKITRTDPAAGQELEKGATLTIYISKGKEDKKASVPDLYGLSQSAAEKALTDKGLVLGSVDQVESSASVGTVVWQSVSKGTEVSEGTAVNIQISKGKSEQPTTPDTSDEDKQPETGGESGGSSGSSGGDTQEPTTPTTGSATIPVALPDNTDIAHVVISVDGVVQYDETHETSLGSISVPLTSTPGQHEVTVSVDGVSSSQTYTFS